MNLNEFVDHLNEGIFKKKGKGSVDPEKAGVEKKANEIVDQAIKTGKKDLAGAIGRIISKKIDTADPEAYDFYYEVEERALEIAKEKSK